MLKCVSMMTCRRGSLVWQIVNRSNHSCSGFQTTAEQHFAASPFSQLMLILFSKQGFQGMPGHPGPTGDRGPLGPVGPSVRPELQQSDTSVRSEPPTTSALYLLHTSKIACIVFFTLKKIHILSIIV